MALVKIDDLIPKGAQLDPTDLFEILEDDGLGGYQSKSITGQDILDAAGGGGGGGNTIYTADDSLTGDRTIDGAGYFINFDGFSQFKTRTNAPPPTGEAGFTHISYGSTLSDIIADFQNEDTSPCFQVYGDKSIRTFGNFDVDGNMRFNSTAPKFYNNGSTSGKQYVFASEISGFNEISLILGVPGGLSTLNTTGEAWSMNKPIRFDFTNAWIYTTSSNGIGLDGANSNIGHVFIRSSGGISFGGTTGDQTVHASSIFDVKFDGRGSHPFPPMTYAQRMAISSPGNGLFALQTDTSGSDTPGLYCFLGGSWQKI